MREDRAVLGAVAELNALALSGKYDLMIARDSAAAQRGEADRPLGAVARQAGAANYRKIGKRGVPASGGGLAKQQCGARRRIDLGAVVHFDDFDVPGRAQPFGGFAHQSREQRDAKRGVAGLENRDVARGFVDQGMMRKAEPGGADQDRLSCGARGGEIGGERAGDSEIDEHVGFRRQRHRIAARVDAASKRRAVAGDRIGDGAAHPPCAAQNPDRRHRMLSQGSRQRMAESPRDRQGAIARLARRFALSYAVAMRAASNIVILTGAGISAESGIATFRGPGGLWEGHRVEDVCTPEALARDPALVHRFYDLRRTALASVSPNAAHGALARFDAAWPGELLIVTQNVDDLHERAGAQRLLHMHGELRSALCAACGAQTRWEGAMPPRSTCPACGAAAVRPDIVFFGEMPYRMEVIEAALARADIFVSIGTSGAVYPAAGFVQTARWHGAETLELNLEPSAGSHLFDESRTGPASVLVPQWVDAMLAAVA